jgi:hypothetical protein
MTAMYCMRIRRLIAGQLAWFCAAGILLAALQPFIATHFRHDGWEDEPGFRIRGVGESTQFELDARPGHRNELEVTLFVPSAARVDAPDALQHGLDGLMALVWLLVPLTLALRPFIAPAPRLPS